MPAIERILFPVDFSPQCEGAVHYLKAMAAATRAEVVFFHVINAPDYLFMAGELGAYSAPEAYQSYKVSVQEKLDRFLHSEFPNAQRKVCDGEPGASITAFARSNDIDLIMMPTHGLGLFRRFLIGSVTAKVLHDAHCPVWTGVHMENAPPAEKIHFDRIFCAVDLNPEADAALRWATDFVAVNGGRVTIVHAVPTIEARPAKYFDTEFHLELRRQATAEIEKLRERVGSDAEILLVDGDSAKTIREAALEGKADLLVIARGKYAYDNIRNAPCPTVSV